MNYDHEKADQLLAAVAKVQAARRKNWKSVDGPEDEALETKHAESIRAFRRQLNSLDQHQHQEP